MLPPRAIPVPFGGFVDDDEESPPPPPGSVVYYPPPPGFSPLDPIPLVRIAPSNQPYRPSPPTNIICCHGVRFRLSDAPQCLRQQPPQPQPLPVGYFANNWPEPLHPPPWTMGYQVAYPYQYQHGAYMNVLYQRWTGGMYPFNRTRDEDDDSSDSSTSTLQEPSSAGAETLVGCELTRESGQD